MRRTTVTAVLASAYAALAVAVPTAQASVRTPAALLEWMADHPQRAGLVAVRPRDGRVVLASAPNARFPLASVRKVLILGAYADAVARGRIDPSRRVAITAVERWYWPGTDGGAHPQAVAEWEARGVVQGQGEDRSVPVDEVARAMIRWSDNAAADHLLAAVGPRAVRAFARRHRMRRQDPLPPLFGEYVAWTTRSPARWRALSVPERTRLARRLARRTSVAEAVAAGLPGPVAQRRFAAAGPAGTPREWARLMARLAAGRGVAPAAEAVVRRHLEWPLEDPANREVLARFGTKGGTLPGVVAEASYLRPRGKAGLAVTVFLRGLPAGVQRDLGRSFAQQELILRLAADRDFLADARRRLSLSPRRWRRGP